MPPKKNSPPSVTQNITGDNNVVIAGNGNTVNQTIIQKFFNIFRDDAETTDQRNRRIMLGHVENFWVKGILEKSMYGAALLDLGIKEDPDAVKTYLWAIKREVNKETLPAGTSMLEIFEEIGIGRSLLILGAPGSGKTTMLLELTRQLIERAREDGTEPIPVIFNLSSWTEKLTLADWLARELNIIYTVPKKLAPTWVKENKMLLLLDGLDEVKQESRDKCVDAINQFRKENGLTSMAVCSRIQDYAELTTRLSFDGAIELQPLTSKQVNEYFKRFGKGLAGIRQVLEKDTVLREMAETPLFLSIMTLAYRDMESKNILVSDDLDVQREHLFDTYIARMFERPERSKNERFKKQDVLRWLSWLAQKMINRDALPYLFENMQPKWLNQKNLWGYRLIFGLSGGLLGALFLVIIAFLLFYYGLIYWSSGMLRSLMIFGLISGLGLGLSSSFMKIEMVDTLKWDWKKVGNDVSIDPKVNGWLMVFIVFLLISFLTAGMTGVWYYGLLAGLLSLWILGLGFGLKAEPIRQTTYPGQRIFLSIRNSFVVLILFGLAIELVVGLGFKSLSNGAIWGLFGGLIPGLLFGGFVVIQHFMLRTIIAFNHTFPWKVVPFLNYCTDLIFLRRVGGGYIFVHRLLMEHFAAMYPEER